jgi:hypothetical protein
VIKRLLQIAMLAVAWTANAQEESISDFTLSPLNGVFSGTAGWTFTTATKTAVTDLGCLDFVIADQGTIDVGLWADDGTLLASASIGSGSPLINQTRYEPITPLLLAPGQTCHIGAYSPSPLGAALNVISPELGGAVSLSPDIQLGGCASSDSGFSFPAAVNGGSGAMFLGANFRFWTAPRIIVSPASQTVPAGTDVVFNATVAGTSPLSYQWLFNGTNLPGGTDNPLTLTNVQPSQAGGYSLVVTNLAGSAASSVATLTVLVPPLIRNLSLTSTNVTLTFLSVTNQTYTLEYKNSLTDSQWLSLPPAVPGTGGLLSLIDTNSPAPARFYRIRCGL